MEEPEVCKGPPAEPWPCASGSAVSPQINVVGGSVVKLIIWAKLEASACSGSAYIQVTMNPMVNGSDNREISDSEGGIYANIKLADSSEWREYSTVLTTPPNTTHVAFYSHLRGPNSTATWSLGDIRIEQLDNTLRNVIRTTVTDVEVWSPDFSTQYKMGRDFTIINFNHDEIRGMARDSRSLRSGLSNAELLAKDMNALQALVTKHLGPKAHAMYWDDMVNPDHNGTYHSQATSRLNSNTH